ncbi:MAG: hypothetical protein HFJ17_05485 [Clostridia bacterium]|nr:hypothetical protein [Clostridia bacterium]
MKKTRNVFVLKGKPEEIKIVLDELHFKGTAILTVENITNEAIRDIFYNNKSVITNSASLLLRENSICITVINGILPKELPKYYIDLSSDNIVAKFEEIAAANDCDIGDHVSNSSGIGGAPSIDDCAYCKHIRNNYNNRAVYLSKSFFVIPTLGQFITGYLLIIPLRHVLSISELTPSEFDEFLTVLDDIKYILKLTYNNSPLFVWENGTGDNGIGKAKDSVVHAHVHIAPSKLTTHSIEQLSGFDFTQIQKHELLNYGKYSYLLISDDNRWLINDNTKLYKPRQYIRQVLAEEYNISGDQWNWRLYPFHDLIDQTLTDIYTSLRRNWDSLPERIRENTVQFL